MRVLGGDNEVVVFADFGNVFGNYDFVSPLKNKLKVDSESLSTDNVINVLDMKQIFNIEDTEKEFSFNAQNFDSHSSNQQFISLSRNIENINAVEQIITSKSLQMKDEDVLLSFLLAVCKNNKNFESFIPLFGNVYLEYCSSDKCKEFISFASEITRTRNMEPLILCIGGASHNQKFR